MIFLCLKHSPVPTLPAANYILVWREARERHVRGTCLAKVQARIQRAPRTHCSGLQHIRYTAHLAFIEIVTHHFQTPSENLTSLTQTKFENKRKSIRHWSKKTKYFIKKKLSKASAKYKVKECLQCGYFNSNL